MAGAPGMDAFKIAVRSGLFKICPITEKGDSGQDLRTSASVLKGKTKRPTPGKAQHDWIDIPPELTEHNQEIDLHLDIVLLIILSVDDH
mmetsp:Transcript_41851/g.100870  ORF Transcript_41851/g.100870 Transcript_41851/m.100870 type:complete len:89 (+) Transcript_41851:254-520(+)